MRRIWLAAIAWSLAAAAQAGPVGERHLQAIEPTAAMRDAQGRDTVRVTVWYPAAAGVQETRLDIGPPGKPFFLVGAAAPEAPFADEKPRPVILLSHGYGGAARMMGWFGTAMAQAGYVVVAVDHPGNNGLDKMTPRGSILSWNRAKDLRAALEAAKADPVVGPHIDPARVGLAGFSAGGYTSLVAAGARANPQRFLAFCRREPQDGVCRPQKEYPLTADQVAEVAASPAAADAGQNLTIPGVKAAFAMGPAIVQGLEPESLAKIKVPVAIILGSADAVAPPQTNGRVAASALPRAELKELPGVGHYEFLSACTPEGRAAVELCREAAPQGPVHQATIEMALALFGRTLGKP
jgi:predicted dienelactone hydrolase